MNASRLTCLTYSSVSLTQTSGPGEADVVAGAEIRTMASRYSLCGAGLCIGYDGGYAVSAEYESKFEFTGSTIPKVVFDVDVERHVAAAIARD